MTKALDTTSKTHLEPPTAFTDAQVQLILRTICRGASPDELSLFLALCRRTGLDPFARQIFAVRRWDSREKREVMQTQVSIDGARLIAQRSGKYAGQTEPQWCGPDGRWVNVWLAEEPPAAARIGVLRTDFHEPCYAVARYGAYCQVKKEGGANAMWARMPDVMLSKCAESLALRKAFPQELSGVYTGDEMDQANRDPDPPHTAPPPLATPAKAPVEHEAPAPPSPFAEMIAQFGELKARLGPDEEHAYYSVLSEFGIRHANQFADLGKARAAYRKLAEKVRKYEADRQAEEDADIIDAAIEEIMPPEEGVVA